MVQFARFAVFSRDIRVFRKLFRDNLCDFDIGVVGFIGNEYKQERKILLRNLDGSSAFKSGSKKEVADNV